LLSVDYDRSKIDVGVSEALRYSIRYVHPSHQRLHTSSTPGNYELKNRFLYSSKSIPYAESEVAIFLIRVSTFQNTLPGRYSLPIKAQLGDQSVSINLDVNVLDAILPASNAFSYGVYYNFPPEINKWNSTGVIEELVDIREHGGNFLKPNISVNYAWVNGSLVPQYDRLDQALNLIQESRFRGAVALATGAPILDRLLDNMDDQNQKSKGEKFKQALAEGIKLLENYQTLYPEIRIYMTHYDEVIINHRKEFATASLLARSISNLPIFFTLDDRVIDDSTDMEFLFSDAINRPSFTGFFYDRLLGTDREKKFRSFLKKSNADRTSLLYHNIRSSTYDGEWARLANSYYLFDSPFGGHIPWIYMLPQGDPLNDLDGPKTLGRDYGYVARHPQTGALLSSVQWEGFLDGTIDMRLLSTLVRTLDDLENEVNDVELQKWRMDVSKFLDELERQDFNLLRQSASESSEISNTITRILRKATGGKRMVKESFNMAHMASVLKSEDYQTRRATMQQFVLEYQKIR